MGFVCLENEKSGKNQSVKNTTSRGRPCIEVPKSDLEFLVAEGFSNGDIATYFDCSIETIKRLRKSYNIASTRGGEREYSGRPPLVLDDDDIELISRLIAEGLSNKEIGEFFGCSYKTIKQFRHTHNIDDFLEKQITSLYSNLTFPTVSNISRKTGFSIKYVRKVLSKKSLLYQAESYRKIEGVCSLQRLHFIDTMVLSNEYIDESFECKPFFKESISRTGKRGCSGGIKNTKTYQAFQAAKGQ